MFALFSLCFCAELGPGEILTVHTDSKYVGDGFASRVTSLASSIADLWESLWTEVDRVRRNGAQIKLIKVKSHLDDVWLAC